MPTGLGKFSPKARTASSRGSAAGRAQRHIAQGLDRQGDAHPPDRAPAAAGGTGGRRSRSPRTLRRHGLGPYRPMDRVRSRRKETVAEGRRLKAIIPIYWTMSNPETCEAGMASASLTHNQIWTAIDRLAARAKLSRVRSRQEGGPRPDHLQQVQAHHAGRPAALAVDRIGRQGAGRDRHQGRHLRHPDHRQRQAAIAQAVPLIGFAEAGAGGYFDDGGFPVGKGWDEIAFPSVTDEHAYALEISGDSMKPAYRDGDVIIVSPAAPVRHGDRVVVKTKDGEVMVKELKRKTAKQRRTQIAQRRASRPHAVDRRTWCGSRASSGRASSPRIPARISLAAPSRCG